MDRNVVAEAGEKITLDEIAREPGRAECLSADALRPLMSQLAMAQGALRSRWFIVSTEDALKPAPQPEPPDRMLKVAEAAVRIGIARDTLYRNADDYPFTRRPRPHALRFSERGIEEWLRAKHNK
jgi:predicted DNA-binding transcriptional regulator AlpA